MDTLYTLKEKYPALVLPEVETFLATQDERTIDFVAYILRELLIISPHATSASWLCFTAPSVYALTKVMRYYLNATVKIVRDDEMELYEANYQWPEGKLAERLTAQVA